MKTYLSKLTLMLVAVGFLASCGGDPNIESAKLNLNRQDYDKVLESANMAIEANPENPLGYYYKAVALSELTQKLPPDQRQDGFAETRDNFKKSKALFQAQERSTSESRLIPLLLGQAWAEEYNLAIGLIVPDEGEPTSDDLRLSLHHLANSIVIAPDSIQGFDVSAEVHFMLREFDDATRFLSKAIELDENPEEANRFLRLAYFHSVAGNQEKITEVLLAARDQFPSNIEIVQELANNYLATGMIEEALQVVRDLIDTEPDNAQYRLVFGSQVYQFVLDLGDDLRSAFDVVIENNRLLRQEERRARPNQAEINRLKGVISEAQANLDRILAQIDDYTQQAEAELLIAAELDDTEPVTFYTLGIIYQNRAANLFELRNSTDDMQQADKYDAEARDMLRKALPYYERAAELEPNNTEFWMMLFRVYTTLGMTEKALEAQERAGI